ncbi:MAG: PucR family transcriptional regulator [Nocardia sp.]|uniref:PucR family transcriptional regulator n=1 Tax=Nocardia sp. TaxID=1821 RepID=UPI0026392ADB|nr:PucR family transcriptional regulator [Nocardia sp.]MCU1646881.1 PucR family transcriptional regulator [Nocardia sp.]
MAVPVSWILSQPDLSIPLRGGAAGIGRTIDLVVTTELENPFRWLSGGELVLTTGMHLPGSAAGRATYLRRLNQRGVAAVGFGIGLTHPDVPADLVAAADDIGIPLLEVPLPTPFAAIVKRITERAAQLQHDDLLRASRAQPRMTRALVRSGARAIVRELATSLRATVLVLDANARVTDVHPAAPNEELLHTVRTALAADRSAGASGVATDASGHTITHQRIGVGGRVHGDLVVVSTAPLSAVDQILLGHANSLLTLDFEKPARLWEAQHRLNSTVLGLLLNTDADLNPAWTHLAQAADAAGRIRVLAADCDTTEALDGVRSIAESMAVRSGHPLFLHIVDRRVLVVLPGVAPVAFAGQLAADLAPGLRRSVRFGLSGEHSLRELVTAADAAGLAASAAERGSAPSEFGTLTGSSLLSFDTTRRVLDTLAHTVLTPLTEHDSAHGTDLLISLRAYLEANGQWEAAAAATGVHRHTLRKRITIAQGLLGCDLDSARVRAELLLAILARGN